MTIDSVGFVLVLGNNFTQHTEGLPWQWVVVDTGFPRCPMGTGS